MIMETESWTFSKSQFFSVPGIEMVFECDANYVIRNVKITILDVKKSERFNIRGIGRQGSIPNLRYVLHGI